LFENNTFSQSKANLVHFVHNQKCKVDVSNLIGLLLNIRHFKVDVVIKMPLHYETLSPNLSK